jgi:hypothetical protein
VSELLEAEAAAGGRDAIEAAEDEEEERQRRTGGGRAGAFVCAFVHWQLAWVFGEFWGYASFLQIQ